MPRMMQPGGGLVPDDLRPFTRTPRRRQVRRPFTRPTASMVHDPFFAYTTGQIGGAALAINTTGTGTISIQAAENFLCRYITCDYDQSDWTFRVVLGGLSANLFNEDIRGALLFGRAAGATVQNWPRGMELDPPMLIPSNTTVTFHVTNGGTGALNIFFALVGQRITG